MYDITQIRTLFPITDTHAYLNNPAIGPLSRTAHAAAIAFLDERMHSPWPDPAPSGLLRLRDPAHLSRHGIDRVIAKTVCARNLPNSMAPTPTK